MRTKTQSLTGCKASLGVLAMMGSFALAGCHGSVESLDQRVAEMIAERQKLALGAEGVSDAAVATPDDRTAVGLYAEQPATNNPAAGQLPAKPTTEAESEGIVVDPAFDGDSLKLDLPALLAYAIEHAPEYRREKEQLFLSTLSLIIERHL